MSSELLHHFQSKQQNIEERIAAGKALREKSPGINQGELKSFSVSHCVYFFVYLEYISGPIAVGFYD